MAAVIALNIVVGFWQEYNAEKTMDSLKSLSSPTASVVRASENITIPSVEIVPGDVVDLKTGDTVPADLRCAITDFLCQNPLYSRTIGSSRLSTLKQTRRCLPASHFPFAKTQVQYL